MFQRFLIVSADLCGLVPGLVAIDDYQYGPDSQVR